MPAKMLPPSIPGGQPGAPMPRPAPKPKSLKRQPSKNQMGPKSTGGFGVQAPPQMQMKTGGHVPGCKGGGLCRCMGGRA